METEKRNSILKKLLQVVNEKELKLKIAKVDCEEDALELLIEKKPKILNLLFTENIKYIKFKNYLNWKNPRLVLDEMAGLVIYEGDVISFSTDRTAEWIKLSTINNLLESNPCPICMDYHNDTFLCPTCSIGYCEEDFNKIDDCAVCRECLYKMPNLELESQFTQDLINNFGIEKACFILLHLENK